jgi:threonylcarbamoyladenosine tRNA methylthiotransferase MtaB
MRNLDRAKRKAFINLNAGTVLEGLVQHKADSNTGMLKAVTSNYLTVLLDPASGLKGEIIRLVIEDCDDNLVLKGKVV